MAGYMAEALQRGIICRSTSPASNGFSLAEKKDGGLQPCINYRGLNVVMVKYLHPLLLVLSATEQLRVSSIYTKIDLRSAYNLERIRAGDEWKTAFSTTSGHYLYNIMGTFAKLKHLFTTAPVLK